MAARKPAVLNQRHDTKADQGERQAAEAAMTPKTLLTSDPPSALKNHAEAIKVWKRLIGLYFEVDGQIVTSFDSDLLAKYCLLEEELLELETIRAAVLKLWKDHTIKLDGLKKLRSTDLNLKTYYQALGEANALLKRFQGMDARIDGKRKLLLQLSQSLYLTPRSRAGVPPPEKPPEKPKSKMDRVIDDGKG